MELILVDPKASLCDCWRRELDGDARVRVVQGRFEDLETYDCLVSAANSFGIMDGGVDGAITAYFGEPLMARVQRAVCERFLGEQPVGTSMIVETGHAQHPYLAHTPTMRVPRPITAPDTIYNAMWAMLVAVTEHNRQTGDSIRTIACPGLGTATGRVSPEDAARQMATAWRFLDRVPAEITWEYATARADEVEPG